MEEIQYPSPFSNVSAAVHWPHRTKELPYHSAFGSTCAETLRFGDWGLKVAKKCSARFQYVVHLCPSTVQFCWCYCSQTQTHREWNWVKTGFQPGTSHFSQLQIRLRISISNSNCTHRWNQSCSSHANSNHIDCCEGGWLQETKPNLSTQAMIFHLRQPETHQRRGRFLITG